jgi:hypothetical protein
MPKSKVLKPNDSLKLIWDVFSLTILSAFYIYIPLQISFSPLQNSQRMFIDILIFVFLLIDVGLSLNTGIFVNGIIIEKKIRIRKHYVKKIMLIDLIAILPFLIQFITPHNDQFLQLLLFFKFSHYMSNLNILKDHIESLLQGDEAFEGVFSLVKLILTILFIAHLLCCIFHYIAISKVKDSTTWLSIKHLEEAPWEVRYLYSIYWSIVTMITVGYGDLTPQNSQEVLFTCCAMLIGCGMFAYSINIIGTYTEKISRRNNEFRFFLFFYFLINKLKIKYKNYCPKKENKNFESIHEAEKHR